MDIVKEIELLNKIIIASIDCGGDSGGPYFCSYHSIEKTLYDWLAYHNLIETYVIQYIKGYPQIKLKAKW